jgi:hypothetical protein
MCRHSIIFVLLICIAVCTIHANPVFTRSADCEVNGVAVPNSPYCNFSGTYNVSKAPLQFGMELDAYAAGASTFPFAQVSADIQTGITFDLFAAGSGPSYLNISWEGGSEGSDGHGGHAGFSIAGVASGGCSTEGCGNTLRVPLTLGTPLVLTASASGSGGCFESGCSDGGSSIAVSMFLDGGDLEIVSDAPEPGTTGLAALMLAAMLARSCRLRVRRFSSLARRRAGTHAGSPLTRKC